jgi:uncharacterized protein (DUF58 family)
MLSAEETRRLERLSIRAASNASPSSAVSLRQAAAVGQGLDFHDFRHYQPGDDPRRIDWTIAARHRQLVVRQFRAEGHVRVHVLVDTSRSMALGTPSKIDCAARLAAALAFTATEHGDAVGVATFDDGLRAHVAASAGRPQLFRVMETLRAVTAHRPSNIDRALQQYGGVVRGPGLAVVLSDFFQPDLTLDGVRFLLYRGLSPALVQVVSDDELSPPFDEDVDTLALDDVERPRAASVVVDPGALPRYREQMNLLAGRLAAFCAEHRTPWLRLTASTPFEAMLNACVRAGLLATAA